MVWALKCKLQFFCLQKQHLCDALQVDVCYHLDNPRVGVFRESIFSVQNFGSANKRRPRRVSVWRHWVGRDALSHHVHPWLRGQGQFHYIYSFLNKPWTVLSASRFFSIQSYFKGKLLVKQDKWLIAYALVLLVSIVDWFVSVGSQCPTQVRVRRVLRPFFLLQNSQLMKKTVKSIRRTLPQICRLEPTRVTADVLTLFTMSLFLLFPVFSFCFLSTFISSQCLECFCFPSPSQCHTIKRSPASFVIYFHLPVAVPTKVRMTTTRKVSNTQSTFRLFWTPSLACWCCWRPQTTLTVSAVIP